MNLLKLLNDLLVFCKSLKQGHMESLGGMSMGHTFCPNISLMPDTQVALTWKEKALLYNYRED